MVYAVIPFQAGSAVAERLAAVPNAGIYYDMAPAAYFISYQQGTTKDLANAIGYDGDAEVGTGIVLPVSNYFGYAAKDLWEWIAIHAND